LSIETLTFSQELEKLDTHQAKTKEDIKKLRKFILSDDFLVDRVKFEELLGEFQDNLVTLIEITQTPLPTIPLLGLPQGLPEMAAHEPTKGKEEEKKIRLSYGKTIIAVAAIILCYAAVDKGWFPRNVLLYLAAATVGLMFLPPALKAVQRVIHGLRRPEKEELKPLSSRLEDWIHDTLAKMRNRYIAAWLLAKIQNQTALPKYEVLGIDEVLYVRRKQFSVLLPHQFLSEINRIVNECDRNIWTRKTLLVTAIVQSRQGVVGMRAEARRHY